MMSKPLKIAQLISSGGLYGAENMLVNLLGELRGQGPEVVLYVLNNSHNSHVEIATVAQSCGTPVTIIPCTGRIDRHAIRILRRSLLNDEVSVLHTHGYKADMYGFWATRWIDVALISTCHNWTKASLPLRLYCRLNKWILRRFACVVAVSAQVEAELLRGGIRRARLRYVQNGVRTVAFADSAAFACPHQVLTIGMATRLVQDKGIEDLLVVALDLKNKHDGLRFLIAGDGPLRASFQAQVSAVGLADHITFLGFVPDMPAFYRSLDIFVLPSLREGLPMSLLEAMAAGKPAIASNIGGIPKAVINQWSGLLIEPGDKVSLASSLERLIEDAPFRRLLGTNARMLIGTEFSSRVMAREYLRLYRCLRTANP